MTTLFDQVRATTVTVPGLASALVRGNAAGQLIATTLSANFVLSAGGTLSLNSALTSIDSVTSTAGQNLTLGVGTGGTALTIASATLAATFAKSVTVNGNSLTIDGGAGAINMLQLGGNATSDAARIRMMSLSTRYNWQIGMQQNVDNGWEVTPSTAAGGTTFSTPAIQIDASTLTLRCNGPLVAQGSSNAFRITNSQTPASASAAGTAGTITWDGSYIYVCTATNTWKRAALSTW